MPLKITGKKYVIQNKEYVLYPISALAQQLSVTLQVKRSTQTIRKWEQKKIIPPAIFRLNNKRLYSKEQIDLICKIAKEEQIKKGLAISSTNFSSRLWREMGELNKKLKGGK